ncbi:NUT family member 1 [Sorex fumeus]|uniref:NUT family member 1 n=1 Tax=Sorex fumeus TaxID=62283 RepID=UPI0024AD4F36|nr:NUT family member 1 [Sorex fumeus]
MRPVKYPLEVEPRSKLGSNRDPKSRLYHKISALAVVTLGISDLTLILETSRQPQLVFTMERMASDGASPLLPPGQGQDMTMKAGAPLPTFTALPLPPPTPGPSDQPPWEPPAQPPMPPAFSPSGPLVLSAFPSPLLLPGDGGLGPSGAGVGKVIVKVKTDEAESRQTQNFVLSQTNLNWMASGAPCGTPESPSPQFLTDSNVKTLLPTEAVVVTQEGLSAFAAQAPPPAAQLAPIMPPERAWPGAHGSPGEGGSEAAPSKTSLGDLSYTSKGVYENFRRWQRYKALARRHLSQSPDTEALSCFLIPVLRSLARLKPAMTLEEGLPRAVQEWEHTSNYDRMIFYEMAEKFMEFEAEEEIQVQNMQLNGSQGRPLAAPMTLERPGPSTPEVCQQPVYIPKKAASKSRAPRRRQRKNQRPPAAEAPKEIPPEAVKEYADIMESLVGSCLTAGEADGKQEEEEQQQGEGIYPDPGLLSYIDELCSQEVFVSKVEAVIHPQFLADLLSPEQQRDPLALIEELEQEEGLSLAELVEKRLLALEEEEAGCSGVQWESSPSVSDEDEDGGGRLRPSPGGRGPGGAPRLGKAASLEKRAREGQSGQDRPHRDGNTLLTHSGWDLQLELATPQGTAASLEAEPRGSPGQDDLGGAGLPEALPLCWQEGTPLSLGPDLEVGLAGLSPLPSQGVEPQVLRLQEDQQMGVAGVLPLEELSVGAQESSSGALWGEDGGPLLVQSYQQEDPALEAAPDTPAPLSPGLWLGSEMETIGLELPLQIEEVIESFHAEECTAEAQGGYLSLESESSISLGARETIAEGKAGRSVAPCGGTQEGLEERSCSSLPLQADSLALRPTEEGKLSPEGLGSPGSLWADGCSPLLESSVVAATLGVSKDSLLPACQGDLLILGPQEVASYPKVGSRDSSITPLLGTAELLLDTRDAPGLQLLEGAETDQTGQSSYEPPSEGREDADLAKSKDLSPLLGNQQAQVPGTPKSTSSRQSLGDTSPGWGVPSAGRGSPPLSSADFRAKLEDEDEDEELSNFAYLLASKLSLSPRAVPLSPHPASGLPLTGKGVPRASKLLSAEARGAGKPLYSLAKSSKRALATGPLRAEKQPYPRADPGVARETSPPLGVSRASQPQPRKRRRDSFVTGRRKKRRRNQ